MNEISMRDYVVDSACLNRRLLEFTTRKLHRFVLKIFKILKRRAKTRNFLLRKILDIVSCLSSILRSSILRSSIIRGNRIFNPWNGLSQ